jgi:type I restriction enzyme R subunit
MWHSPRVTSRAELVKLLGAVNPRLMCALIHKFDATDLTGPAPTVQGRVHVFVDECHRTQGGDMNKQMKRWLSQAIFIGFTGTPLLRSDEPKLLTRNVFGTYIHTYKFHQAVADKVVLDLKYQARDVTERLTSPQKIDEWFETNTKNLNNFQKALLRKRWATMEALMSAEGRKREIMAEILLDFARKPRLNENRGTAILVASSIYDACHYFRLFRATAFGPHCGLITSYEPNHNAISREPANGEERYKYDTYTQHVLTQKGQTPQQYADEVKRQFIKEPAQMKLLIVVSKLLTGFDAPSCTYIYLDNELHNHNLFQAICRTNRLDGDDKDYGHIVDFKKLFGDVQEAIAVYSSDELDTDPSDGGGNNNVPLKNALQEGKKQLDAARQALHYLCEPVPHPQEMEQFLHYFCGDAANPEALTETEALRVSFYKAVALFTRAYADLAQEMTEAGYTEAEAAKLKTLVVFYTDIRDAIKKHAVEELDIKPYEADMRHLINTYIQADAATTVGDLCKLSLVEMVVQTGIHDAIAKKLNAKNKLSNKAVAEGIINNVRQTIARTHLADPKFYALMSTLLDDLIKQSCKDAAAYAEFLRKAEELIKRLAAGQPLEGVPAVLHGNAEAVTLFNNLGNLPFTLFKCPQDADEKAALVLQIDKAMRNDAPPGWNGDDTKERVVKSFLHKLLQKDAKTTVALFDIIKNLPGYQ